MENRLLTEMITEPIKTHAIPSRKEAIKPRRYTIHWQCENPQPSNFSTSANRAALLFVRFPAFSANANIINLRLSC